MNIPNKLTVLRLVMVPVFFIAFCLPQWFGEGATDTLSHLTYFACFYGMGIMPAAAFIIIMWREFSISFLRMLMMGKGKAVAANIWGKSKTVLYAVVSILSIAYVVASHFVPGSWQDIYSLVLTVLFYLAALASLLSFTTYLSAILKSRALSGMTR